MRLNGNLSNVCTCLRASILPSCLPYSRLPERTREKIIKHIQSEFYGEQQPGTAFVVKNSGKGEKYKHIAFLCLARAVDASIPFEYAYTAMRGLILAIMGFNKSEQGTIEVVAIPSFALNNSTPEQKRYAVLFPLHLTESNI